MMSKKEQARVEELLTRAALRSTEAPGPDVPPGKIGSPSKGWMPLGSYLSPRVEPACSEGAFHGIGDRIKSHGGRWLYSTKLAALKALRCDVERACASALRGVDRQIESEEADIAKAAQAALNAGAVSKPEGEQ